jgi:type III secretion protein R
VGVGTNSFDPVYLFFVVAGVGLLPLVAVMVTSYTKIVIILSLLRNAIGLQNVPPPSVTSGLAIVLSVFIMYPVINSAVTEFDKLPREVTENRSPRQLLALSGTAREPMRAFLSKHAGKREVEFFMQSAKKTMPEKDFATLAPDNLVVLVPAFALTELSEAFEVGFLIVLPFLIVDFLFAAGLMALGMQMMSPTTVSLPFKILLFVMVDGWEKLFGALLLSYR